MRKSAVLKHFGTQAAVAEILGISRAAVNKWGKTVPLESATALEILTEGAVKVDESMYPMLQRANDAVAAGAH